MMIYIMIGLSLVVGASSWMARGHWDAGEIAKVKLDTEQQKAQALAIADVERKRADEIASAFEAKLSNLRIINRTINNEVRHETEKVVYGDPNCDVPASGVLLINKSVREANRAAGYVQTEVPAAAAAPDLQRSSNDGRPVQPRQ